MSFAEGSLSKVKALWYEIGVMAAPCETRTGRFASADKASSEQHARDFIDVGPDSTAVESEGVSLPPV